MFYLSFYSLFLPVISIESSTDLLYSSIYLPDIIIYGTCSVYLTVLSIYLFFIFQLFYLLSLPVLCIYLLYLSALFIFPFYLSTHLLSTWSTAFRQENVVTNSDFPWKDGNYDKFLFPGENAYIYIYQQHIPMYI